MSDIQVTVGLNGLIRMPLEHIMIIPLDNLGPVVEAQYNPTEVEFTKQVNWANKTGNGTDCSDLEFKHGQSITIKLNLLFDRYEEMFKDVRPVINDLIKLTLIRDPYCAEQKKKRPPMVKIVWGKASGDALFDGGFQGVVESVQTTYTMFTPEGIPCRAKVVVSLLQSTDDSGGGGGSGGAAEANPNPNGPKNAPPPPVR